MITVQIPSCDSLSQAYYDDVVNAIPLDRLRCSCGQSGHLIRHAYDESKDIRAEIRELVPEYQENGEGMGE